MGIREPKPDKGKLVRATQTDAPPPDTEHPSFSLRHLKNKYCISRCTKKEKVAFVKKLRILTQMSWAQIKQSGRHKHGYEPISQLDAQLPDAAPTGARAIAFRFADMAPMIGYREHAVFYVVAFDRKFKLYKH